MQSSTERRERLPIGQICWQMQRYFSRERKLTQRVNRSPTSREIERERRSRMGGVEAAGKVDSTSRIPFPCASTMRKCETPSVLEKQLSFAFSLSPLTFATFVLSNPTISHASSFFSWLLLSYIFYYFSTISKYHNVEKRIFRCKTKIVYLKS